MRFDSTIADRVSAVIFFALGALMLWGGYVMDRLEVRQIHPASIPGLVPMILGAALMFCAVLLAKSARKFDRSAAEIGSWRDFGATAIWSCLFALVLVSRIPFFVATAIYIAGFCGWFLLPPAKNLTTRLKILIFVLLFSVVAASTISALFRYGFLVRLP